MKKRINIEDQTLSYTLRSSVRAKRMRLAVYCDGAIVVTAPRGLQKNIIERYIKEKSEWLFSKIAFFKQFEGKKISSQSKNDYMEYRQVAYELADKRVKYFNKIYKFEYSDILIKNQKTRWGSCSKKRSLNFNYKIAFLPKRVADYIIVHELCHLKEFNHSRKFWNLVEKVLPDYKEIKNDLKRSGIYFQ